MSYIKRYFEQQAEEENDNHIYCDYCFTVIDNYHLGAECPMCKNKITSKFEAKEEQSDK